MSEEFEEIQVGLNISEGDYLLINDCWWEVIEINADYTVCVKPTENIHGSMRFWDREALEDKIDFTKEFRHIDSEYLDVFDDEYFISATVIENP